MSDDSMETPKKESIIKRRRERDMDIIDFKEEIKKINKLHIKVLSHVPAHCAAGAAPDARVAALRRGGLRVARAAARHRECPRPVAR
ncbi:jg22230 [Pararge aegeria aegeria]|uniref:Jg22230 protein n=1 Tax=Pararge aegeria aegeria TaxID=348720 RepID=A0A8S4SJE1_9NEOP|nr:jg22230 [Pararge aegeria aegeria]